MNQIDYIKDLLETKFDILEKELFRLNDKLDKHLDNESNINFWDTVFNHKGIVIIAVLLFYFITALTTSISASKTASEYLKFFERQNNSDYDHSVYKEKEEFTWLKPFIKD